MRVTHLVLVALAIGAACVSADDMPGSSCGTVTPEDRYDCCMSKAKYSQSDDYCMSAYPELYSPPLGSSCSTVNPNDSNHCCKTKLKENTQDDWCQQTYPELYPPPGSSCSTVTPGDNEQCCKDKIQENTQDDWCMQTYPELYNQTDSGNLADFPYMAYIESPKAPNGSCGGSLIAPGYVLTAAQCVFKGGEAADAGDVTVFVDGKNFTVETVLVNQDKAQFAEFKNSKSENSWDVAMLALTENSDAKYVALPLSDVPKLGDWLDTTAWQEPKTTVETAKVPAWDGCPPGWADEFCAGGSGFPQSCPDDKGSPAFDGNTQVGLASGPGCDGTPQDYGYFLKLANKGILEQITVWLNSRGGTGLDDNIQSWLIEANKYLYES